MKTATYILVLSLALLASCAGLYAQCPNGDLETGTLAGWQTRSRGNGDGTVNLNQLLASGAGSISIQAPGLDGNINRVNEGNFSIRIGNTVRDNRLELAWYTFTVTSANAFFTFNFATVLEGGHQGPQNQLPFFGYRMCLGNTPTTAAGQVITVPGATFDITRSTPWTTRCINLTPFIGQTVTIYFYVADCTSTGHFGYAYIDGLCTGTPTSNFTMVTPRCISGAITADGSASTNENKHIWTIEESDIFGNRPNPSSEVSSGWRNGQAGAIDLSAIMASNGKRFKCNTYYRVKLAMSNNCVPWTETVQILHVTCPTSVEAGPDKFDCCDVRVVMPTIIGPDPVAGNTYSWNWYPWGTPTAPGPNSKITVSAPGTSTVYVLTATDGAGCTVTDSLFWFILEPIRVNIIEKQGKACNEPTILTAEPEIDVDYCGMGESSWWTQRKRKLPLSYSWSNGATTKSITVNPTTTTTYSVTVSNACYTTSKTITVVPCPSFTGLFPPISMPSGFTPNGDGINDIFFAVDALSVLHNYNALEYEFEVFDRWGGKVYRETGSTGRCQGFADSSIPHWNGKINVNLRKKWFEFWKVKAGTSVMDGVYTFVFKLKNCTNNATLTGTISVLH